MKLEEVSEEALKRIGIRKGKKVLDFGCGNGIYSIPAAKLTGQKGKVYALDKDKEKLDQLKERIKSERFRNIKIIDTEGKSEISLPKKSIDMVLLFDVYHEYFFPTLWERRKLLDEIYRVLKHGGYLSVWPKHYESRAKDEIENANFYLEKEYKGEVVYRGKEIMESKVLSFRKVSLTDFFINPFKQFSSVFVSYKNWN